MTQYDSNNAPEFIEGPGLSDMELGLAPKWPKVVGIISIVWGAVTIGCVGCGVAGSFMQGMAAGQMKGGMPPIVTSPPISLLVVHALSGMTALLLLVAGIMLVMRQPAARAMHLVYGVLSVLGTALSWYIQMGIQAEVDVWAQQNPDADFTKQHLQMKSMGMIIGLAFTVIFMIYPVFCLIWFGAIKKTRDSMTGGIEAAA